MSMEDTKNVPEGIEAAKEMVEKLEKTFTELEYCREASLPNKIQWADIKEHFDLLAKSLQEKIKEVEEKEKAFEEKQSEACKLVTEIETAVAAKELASLGRLQELKDAAVSAIAEARKNCKALAPIPADVKKNKDNKVNTSSIVEPNATTAPEENPHNNKSGDPAKAVAGEVKLHAQLRELCEKMDAKGLLKVLLDNRKLLTTIGQELSTALKSAAEPAHLVLDSLEGFYPPDSSGYRWGEDSPLQVFRRTCHVILEAAAPILRVAEPDNGHLVSSEFKQQAKAIADEWKAKLAGIDIDASNGYSLEAIAFLQLLVTFSIAEEFHEDELCKLVLAVSRRRQAPELCRSLGLIHRMPGVVETLVKTGRQTDAVHFASAFQLTESFPPVPLLKEYLNSVKRSSQENSGDAVAVAGQRDAIMREMSALRAVIKCIEECKLQEEYPVEPLKKRVGELEKAKYEKKRTRQAAKARPKRHQFPGFASEKPGTFLANRQVPPPVYDERGIYPGIAGRYAERYAFAAPPAYEVAGHAPYGQQPGGQVPSHYPDEMVAPPPHYSSPATYGTAGYGSYAGAGYQSSTPSSYAGAGYQSSTQSSTPSIYAGAGYQSSIPSSYAGAGYQSSTPSSYAGAGYQSSTPSSYTGTGYQSSTPSSYGNYVGTGVQPASPNYGSYMGTGGKQPHQSYM